MPIFKLPAVSSLKNSNAVQLLNKDAILGILNDLNSYVDIEHKFPKWMTARIVLKQFIPERTQFVAPNHRPDHLIKILGSIDPNMISIDSDWIMSLLLATPPEDKNEMEVLLKTVASTYTEFLEALCMNEQLEPLLFKPLDRITVLNFNSVLDEKMHACVMHRLPQPLDVARHQLGLASVKYW